MFIVGPTFSNYVYLLNIIIMFYYIHIILIHIFLHIYKLCQLLYILLVSTLADVIFATIYYKSGYFISGFDAGNMK